MTLLLIGWVLLLATWVVVQRRLIRAQEGLIDAQRKANEAAEGLIETLRESVRLSELEATLWSNIAQAKYRPRAARHNPQQPPCDTEV